MPTRPFSPLLPGSDGGLITGTYQPAPSSRFDRSGGGTANRITRPTPFFGVAFATSTESVDPQSETAVPTPSITADDAGKLTGTTVVFGATWNNEDFNQGAPKPDGSRPGGTSGPGGTYDAATGAFTLEWTSLIIGGPFNSFTGVWHLEGTFRARGGAPAATPRHPRTPARPSRGVGSNAVGEGPAAIPADAAASPVTDTTAVEAAAPVAASEDGSLAAGHLDPRPRVEGEGWRPAMWHRWCSPPPSAWAASSRRRWPSAAPACGPAREAASCAPGRAGHAGRRHRASRADHRGPGPSAMA